MAAYVLNPTLRLGRTRRGIECRLPFSGELILGSNALLAVLNLFRHPVELDDADCDLTQLAPELIGFLCDSRVIVPTHLPALARALLIPELSELRPTNWAIIRPKLRRGTVTLLGAPVDTTTGCSLRPRFGPREIRRYWRTTGYRNIFDLGNVALFPDEPTTAFYERLEFLIESIVKVGAMPLVFGGDHTITYPILSAICRQVSPLTVIHFDAHADMGTECNDQTQRSLNHANVIAHIVEHLLEVSSIVQVGVREPSILSDVPVSLPRRMRRLHAASLRSSADLRAFLAPRRRGEKAYVSIDIDVLDPAYAPETTTPRVGGLSLREMMDALTEIGKFYELVGADIVEVCGVGDQYNRAAHCAASLCSLIVRGSQKTT